eukprot:g20296.t1
MLVGLVLIGLPAAGKSTLSRYIRDCLVPAISKGDRVVKGLPECYSKGELCCDLVSFDEYYTAEDPASSSFDPLLWKQSRQQALS